MSCAYQLAAQFSREVTVIEANNTGWGCSGRNAGFVLRGTGRLGLSQLSVPSLIQQNYFHQEYGAGIAQVHRMIAEGNIVCEPQPSGYLKVAHTAKLGRDLPVQAEYLQRNFAYPVQYVSADQLKRAITCKIPKHLVLSVFLIGLWS